MTRLPRTIFLSAALLLIAAAPCAGWEYHSSGNRYTITLPSDWNQFQVSDSYDPRWLPGADPKFYEIGFGKSQVRWADPKVHVRTIAGGGTLEDAERAAAKLARNIPANYSEQYKPESQPTFKRPATMTFDRDRRRFEIHYDITWGQTDFRGIYYGFIGDGQVTMLDCMAGAGDFEQSRETFKQIAESFRFDPGYEYQGPPPSSPHTRVFYALVIGFAVGIILYFIVEKRKRRDEAISDAISDVGQPEGADPP